MSVCAKFQLTIWTRSGWKVCGSGGWGGVGWVGHLATTSNSDIGFVDLSTISGSRNPTIFTISGSRFFFVQFYNFRIQKLQCFSAFWISTISGSRFFFVHFYNFWIQKLQYFCSFWIQKLHHFYDFWGPYGSWGDVCLAPAGGPMDRRARLNLT